MNKHVRRQTISMSMNVLLMMSCSLFLSRHRHERGFSQSPLLAFPSGPGSQVFMQSVCMCSRKRVCVCVCVCKCEPQWAGSTPPSDVLLVSSSQASLALV